MSKAILTKLKGNRGLPIRLSELREVGSLTTCGVRTAIARLRRQGWDIICDRDPSGRANPKYTLQFPKE